MRNRECAGARVLVVEGTPGDHTATVASLLAEQGCSVTVTPAESAIARAVESEFLLAILQPGPDGSTCLEHLRRLREEAPDLHVAVLGARGDVRAAVDALRAHAFEFLEDPVAPAAMAALLHRARQTPPPQQAMLLESLQILTPGLVHELRNPLSGILAGSQMLARLLGGQGTACEYAEIIQEEAQQLERFLGRLVEFGRLGAAGLQCAEAMDLAGLLGRALDAIRVSCAARDIRIVSSFEPRMPPLPGDPGRLSQAFAEILQNAQEAMPDGGTLTVTTRLAVEDEQAAPGGSAACRREWVEVEFNDTGPGMTGETRRRGCEPFFSTRPRALGIGLSLAQAIALAHGGMLHLGEREGAGGHIVVRLPVTPHAGADAIRWPAAPA